MECKMTHRTVLSSLITMLMASQIQAADFSNTYYFGDSLTDSGSSSGGGSAPAGAPDLDDEIPF